MIKNQLFNDKYRDFAFHGKYVQTRSITWTHTQTIPKPQTLFCCRWFQVNSKRKSLLNMCLVHMTFASKRNLCAYTYTLFSFTLTRLHTHAKQNLFKHVFLFLWCLQEFLLPPVLFMLPSYLIVKGVSYRSLADNTDGQCPSQ